jgi:DNA ligase-associated metallophosphoesterase
MPDEKDPSESLILAGERLTLLPQRAVWWESARTLFITDLHLGKEATFRAAGMPVPDQTAQLLNRLRHIIDHYKPLKLIVLGDLIHARVGRCEKTFELIDIWRRSIPDLIIQLIRGNHDRSSGDPPTGWQIECLSEPYQCDQFMLCHYPESAGESPALAGHLHPAVRLTGRGRDALKLPCFLLRGRLLILPAFSEFVDGATQKLVAGDRTFGICDNHVHELALRGDSGERHP